MSANITIDFGGAATSVPVELVLSNCAISVGPQQGVSIKMSSAYISVVANQVSIGTMIGAQLNGWVEVAIDWAAPLWPAVTLDNLEGPATVTWPTASGPQTRNLTPGNPTELTGIAGSPA
jgi:type 1 fimbria pilin